MPFSQATLADPEFGHFGYKSDRSRAWRRSPACVARDGAAASPGAAAGRCARAGRRRWSSPTRSRPSSWCSGLRGIYVQVQQTQDVLTALYRLDADIRQVSRFHREFLLTGLPQFLDRVSRGAAARAGGDRADPHADRGQPGPAAPDGRGASGGLPKMPARWMRQSRSAARGRANDVLRELARPRAALCIRAKCPSATCTVTKAGMQAARDRAVVQRTGQALMVSVLRTLVVVALFGLVFLPDVAPQAGARQRCWPSVPPRWPALPMRCGTKQPNAARPNSALHGREMMLRGLTDAMPQIVFVLVSRWHRRIHQPALARLHWRRRDVLPGRRAGTGWCIPTIWSQCGCAGGRRRTGRRRSWRSSGCAARMTGIAGSWRRPFRSPKLTTASRATGSAR